MNQPSVVYVVLCDDSFDQFCYSAEEMKRERKDLKKMGFEVQVLKFDTEVDAQEYVDTL